MQRTAIATMQEMLEEEQAGGRLELPVDSHAMAYALVRLVESFLYADFIAGERPELEKAEAIILLMLNRRSPRARPSRR